MAMALRVGLRCSRQTPDINLPSAIARQYSGHSIGCRGRCYHIVDYGNVLVADWTVCVQCKRFAEIAAALRGAEALLGKGSAGVGERMTDGDVQRAAPVVGEQSGLVETALPASSPVHGYRHQKLGAGREVATKVCQPELC